MLSASGPDAGVLLRGRVRRRRRPRRRRRRVEACRAHTSSPAFREAPECIGARRSMRRSTAAQSCDHRSSSARAGARQHARDRDGPRDRQRRTTSRVWGHVGDSRLYCFRDGAIVAQTKDHSVVQNMVDAGYLTQAAVRTVAAERSKPLRGAGPARELRAGRSRRRRSRSAPATCSCCAPTASGNTSTNRRWWLRSSHERSAAGWLRRWSTRSCAAAGASRTTIRRWRSAAASAGPEDPDATKVV